MTVTSPASGKELATPWYSDQILPFDITLAGANEYGAMCAAKIFGVEILNEGSGVSIYDAVTEMQATYQVSPSCRTQNTSRGRARARARARAPVIVTVRVSPG